ncbi:MAG: hypothetical protein A3H70_00165 [Candidatus Komeilibacteria bacterium RIFCSPLOWO2_02_FULL_48_11]|uniref:Pseudouridine synthase n=1 Tax=Candidatus Komeilibacteria bacterium RIFCSPLOWO2_02_FULL_48_11 TaxID=1798553 RepID=A0A1G2BRG8_9BACT|nr:MAG: hypothetical protein A3H70_00165 [Candidatus Komeilibacteria bacterium RIFCSPLOWO2_02_FULL_48_11]
MQTFQVETTDKGQRLDKWLLTKLPGFSRSYLQKAVKSGAILVNDKTVAPHFFLKGDEIITADITAPIRPNVAPNTEVKFKIIDEAPDYIVLEKPANLAVHPAAGLNEPTLVDGLLAKYPEISNVGDDKLRPGIVQRLDKDVSGLMVVARTEAMFNHLKEQFKNHSIDKEYVALVHGVMTPIQEHGIIDKPVGRSAADGRRMAAQTDEHSIGQEAKTEYWVQERLRHHTLLRVKIHTGRTHQIRVHLNSLGFPLAGDKIYTNKRIKLAELGRIFLHANKLGFKDLQNQRQEYTSQLPEELDKFFKSLH